ncbi:ATP-dependent helicase [Komagataeibacter medellinensis]|uniref:DNA 3'-5' helicase n=1 Tax=Komagataeibacter medellinensis (strain NBRC 3288 / BCRC 11682 / LMG 1693 / Kondo 51) TaxID=634177 RepID=G2I7U3_KOMMN|nr:ATP-dependent helicase [Komagataeibacter medellinensis]BAK85986.1 DNA helicase II [Komagataeibacter medellinensis NBRC 3288]
MTGNLPVPRALAPVLDSLTPEQRRAAMALGYVLVLAGAGTGKTKTLTAGVATRVGLHGMVPGQILCVTFTNKAAQEMRKRIGDVLGTYSVPTWLGTFHALAARQLRAEPEVAQLRSGFDIRDAEDSLAIVRRLIRTVPKEKLPVPQEGAPGDARQIKKMAERIARLKEDLITPVAAFAHVESLIGRRQSANLHVDHESWRFVVGLYGRYQAILREQNAADFGDLLMWPTLAMLHDAAYHRRWSARFTAVMADEFQDVNRAQYLWLTLLSRTSGELFCVGDDSQSIYSWRGAKVGFLRNFPREFPAVKTFKLEENFRSTSNILDASNAVISFDPSRIEKTLFTRRGEGLPIEVLGFSYATEEAAAIVREIGRRAATGVAWHDMAIIYRQNRLFRTLEEALLHARVPYEIIGDVGFYWRTAVKDALALLTLCAWPDERRSDEAFRRMANRPPRGLGARGLGKIEIEASAGGLSLCAAATRTRLSPRCVVALQGFVQILRQIGCRKGESLGERLTGLLEATGYLDMLRADDSDEAATQRENLAELIELAQGFRRVEHLLEHAALAGGAPGEKGRDRVQLMTMHRSKGLEFRHVFLPAWEEAIFPGAMSRNPGEERRLAYVALTRAMEQATITFCDYRQGGSSRPSRFIDEIPLENRVSSWNHGRNEPRQSDGRWRQVDQELNALGL